MPQPPYLTVETEYLLFEHIKRRNKATVIVDVTNKNGIYLGTIRFYPQWRQFIFAPDERTVFNTDCLTQIADVCKVLTEEWKESHAT